jgi:hypothetical protein
MGGDYYGGRDVVTTTSKSGFSDESAGVIGIINALDKNLDPKRWKDENLTCESLHPIIFALDVTGSMGDWTKIIYDKLPMFYGQIIMQKYLEDPAISFCAIGDVMTDEAPLQVAEFGQGKGLDQVLSKLYLEGGGGGNKHESYDLAANFYLNHVDLCNSEIPFFFVTGDEAFWEEEKAEHIQKVFGHGIKEKSIETSQIWKKLMEKYNVFHVKKPFFDPKQDSKNEDQWSKALGKERILHIKTPKACIDVMLGAIAITSGTRDLNGYIADMKNRGQSEERIAEVTSALKLYADKLADGSIKSIRMVNAKSEDLVSSTSYNLSNSELKASEQEIFEIAELTEKLLNTELDEESKKMRAELKNLKFSKENKVLHEFLCPLTKLIMFDPVMTADGISFERKAIESWMDKHDFSPITGEKMGSKILLPNFALKQLIKDFYELNK